MNTYLTFFIYYIIYSNIDFKENLKLINIIVYSITALSMCNIAYQGIYYGVRVYGNIGYANSYALMLLVTIYLTKYIKENLQIPINAILTIGILYTGSRSTLVYLVMIIIFNIFFKKDESKKQAKDKNNENIVFSFILGIILYAVFESLGFVGLIIAPIIIAVIYYTRNFLNKFITSKIKNKNIFYLIPVIFIIAIVTLSSQNTFQRIKNISFKNGSFQERIIIYGDVIREVLKHPFGNGINMFELKQSAIQSAFYDIRYVHNSVLQISYDIGLVGGVAFVSILIYFLYILIKNKDINTTLIFIIIILHSLLDFDFSYSTIIVLMILIFNLNSKHSELDKSFYNIKFLYSSFVYGVITLFLAVTLYSEGTLALSKYLINSNSNESALNILNSDKRFNDWRVFELQGRIYKTKYDENQSNEALIATRDVLEKGLAIYKDNSNLKWNLAYIYGKLGDENKAIKLRDQLLVEERFYFDVYKEYYKLLKELESKNTNYIYEEKLEVLQKTYYKNKEELNPRSKYIKNQLKGSFENCLNQERKN